MERIGIRIHHEDTGADAPLHPLYHRYPGQMKPQSVYLELDGTDLRAGWSGEIGGSVPMHVWHGITRRWYIPGGHQLLAGAVNRVLDHVTPLVQDIAGGISVAWDGSNRVGRLTPAAVEAERILIAYLQDGIDLEDPDNCGGGIWDAGDWLVAGLPDTGITATTTDDELKRIAADLEAEARDEGITLDGSILEELHHFRDGLQEREEDRKHI